MNCSFGSISPQEGLRDAVEYADSHDILQVCAAGNYHYLWNQDYEVNYPARYAFDYENIDDRGVDIESVMSVASTAPIGYESSFSCYVGNAEDSVYVNVAAPGGTGDPYDNNDILSTTPNYSNWFNDYLGVPLQYGWLAGTSQAAPQVTGLAGLIRSMSNDITAEMTRRVLEYGNSGVIRTPIPILSGH